MSWRRPASGSSGRPLELMMLSRSQCVHVSRLRAVAFDIDGERVFCGSLIGIGILYILHIFPRQNHHMSPR